MAMINSQPSNSTIGRHGPIYRTIERLEGKAHKPVFESFREEGEVSALIAQWCKILKLGSILCQGEEALVRLAHPLCLTFPLESVIG